jgi:transposase
MLGTAPTPAPSSKTMRYWLFRSGDRQINRALCTPFSLCRLQRDERTRIYAERRRAEGKTDREIKRCLKRYIARELNPRPESRP